jgi:predicted phosphodiesterase
MANLQPVQYKYTSTKEYHDAFPCAYRQWRSDSHCNLIHGYSFSMKFYFGTDELDARNWAADYGGLKELKKNGREIDAIYLPQLGDCIEGMNSQGGKHIWRTDLDLTSQIRVYRRLLLHMVKTFAPLAPRVIVPCVPGNHDEAVRVGNSMATTYTDSFALDAASAVADALADHPDYKHVSFVFPKYDTLTVTLDICGTVVGLAHGHQCRGKAIDWWKNMAHGQQDIGVATLLLTGHYHHLRIEQSGRKTWMQAPALDGGSTWFENSTGQAAPAGMLTMLVGKGWWQDVAIL